MKVVGKLILYIVGVLIVLIVAALIAFFAVGNSVIKYGVETGATSALKVPVKLDNIDIGIFRGTVALKGLTVANPAGYQLPTLLKMGGAKTAVKLGSLMSDTVEIESVILDDIELSIEQKGMTNNLQDIINALPKTEEKPAAEPAAEGGKSKNLRIKTLEINNVSVTVKLLPVPGTKDKITFKLAPIKLTDLGTDKKLDVAGLSRKVLVALTEGVAQQGKGLIPDSITGPLKTGLGETQKIVEETGKEAIGIGKNIGEGVKGVGESVIGIFKKKDSNSPAK